MKKAYFASLAYFLFFFFFSLRAEELQSVFTVPSATVSGSANYTYDLQNTSFWSAGVPGEGMRAVFKRDEKTPYVTNTAPLALSHMRIESSDFYLKSDQPFVFSSPSNTIVDAPNDSSGFKMEAPVTFASDVLWNMTANLRLQGDTTFKGDVTMGYVLNHAIANVIFASMAGETYDIQGALRGAYTSNSSPLSPVLAGACKAQDTPLCVKVDDLSTFGGSVFLSGSTLSTRSGLAAPESGACSLPTEHLVSHFDAADESSFTLVKGALVAQWRDRVSSRVLYPAREGFAPVRRRGFLGKLAVVDMCSHLLWGKSGGRPLRFSEEHAIKNAKTLFWVVGSQSGGGWLMGSKSSSARVFHRGGAACRGDIPGDGFNIPSYTGNPSVLYYLNGEPFDTSNGLSGNWDILCATDQTAFSNGIYGFAFDNFDNIAGDRSGYMQLAEFIAYDTELDGATRAQVERYLRQKWLSGRADLRRLVVEHQAQIDVAPAADGVSQTHINRLFMLGELVKSGQGTLVLDHPHDVDSAVRIKEGTLKIETTDDPPQVADAALPARDALIAHFDASDVETLDVVDGLVQKWRAKEGNYALVPRTDANALAPHARTLDNGKCVVDLGMLNSKRVLDLTARITSARTVLMTFSARQGASHLLTDTPSGGRSDFHRGNSPIKGFKEYFVPYGIGSSILGTGGRLETWVDGEIVNAYLTPVPVRERFSTIAFRHPDSASLAWGSLGCDRSNISERSGGMQVAEILVYGRSLSAEEILSATAYLNDKWKNAQAPVLPGLYAAGAGSFAAMCDLSLGCLDGEATLDASGPGMVTVNGFARGWSGALTSSAGAWRIKPAAAQAPSAPPSGGLLAWFDPSDDETCTVNDAGEVVALASKTDAACVMRSLADAGVHKNPQRAYPEVFGSRGVIDCGDNISNRGLALDADLTKVHSVVMVYDATKGGGQLFGACSASQAFQRNINHASKPLFGDVAPVNNGLRQARVWIDGLPTGRGASGMKSGWQIVSFLSTEPCALGMMGIREKGKSASGGGNGYGEVLIYDHMLTQSERMAAEAYLAAKWWGASLGAYRCASQPDMPGQRADASVTLYVPAAEKVSVGYLAGSGGVVKTGDGELAIKGATTELSGVIDVRAGTVVYEAEKLDAAALPVTDGVIAHFDASCSDAFEYDPDGRVTAWKAKYAIGKYGALKASAYFDTQEGAYLPDTLNGRGMLDCGVFGKGQGFVFPETISNVLSVVMLFGSQRGGGFLLGELNDGTNNEVWHRHWGDAGWDKCESPLFTGRGAVEVEPWVDGVRVGTEQYGVLNGGYQLIELYRTGEGRAVSGFGLDRFGYPDRAGGQRYGEVVLFDRVLTEAERQKLRAYFNYRWFDRTVAGSGALSGMYARAARAGYTHVQAGATFDLNGFTHKTERLGGRGTVTGGTLEVTQAVDVSFDGALTVDGKLVFAPEGQILLPEDWKGRYGRWKLFDATEIEGDLAQWTVTGTLNGRVYTARLYKEDGAVWVSVSGPGTKIILR